MACRTPGHMVLREEYGPRPPTKAARVRQIMHLQACGRWEKGITGPELCDAWELALVTIEADAAEASRRLKAVTDPEWVRSRLAETLDYAAEVARRDPREAAAVANAYAGLVGAAAPSKVDVTVRAAPPGIEPALWNAYQSGDALAVARINALLTIDALDTFDALPNEERDALRERLMAWCGGGRLLNGGE